MDNSNLAVVNKCMVYTLSIKQWSGKATDKDAASCLENLKNAMDGAVRVNKQLVFSPRIKDLQKFCNETRTLFTEMTLPWMNDGRRLGSAKAWAKLNSEMVTRKDEFECKVQGIDTEYQAMKDDAKTRLGDLFHEEDYPATITDKYDFVFRCEPVPNPDDIRVQISDEEKARIKEELTKSLEAAQIVAKQDIYDRIKSVVIHAITALQNYKPDAPTLKEKCVFRDSTITNITELTNLLDTLNFDEDKALNGIKVLLNDLTSVATPEELRKDEGKRETVMNKAKAIAESMSAYAL